MDNHIVGTTHQGLGLAVLIPVVENDVELFVRTSHQVWSHIDPPQTCAIQLVALVQVEIGLIRSFTNVSAVVSALHHELHLTIAIYIGHGTVVQRVASDGSTITVDYVKHRNLPVLVIPRLTLGSFGSLLNTLHHRYDLVGAGL